ncbi:MAG: SPW repeat protein [Thermus sp.]|uniref:SPW repeat protein n=1 Tax=unclassified Thermus TaxID=2619321 RepID=UPI0002389375|nr:MULTISPECIES: SPW repeat protein [unclassified Thermus]AEV16664.1 hypothetical protein TCCBUS3UF1_16230 [Thermus sp. CCB_US3_UF1]MCS6869399.1 SPW repeat protein [Thermus sp.]MCS7218303.1 SPW repeat protein [Thermus sp.]MDW8016287.1 SPW repeat protein [Thermus sp.]MDW8356701.1 SPW repeat protein [Thermus sp.]
MTRWQDWVNLVLGVWLILSPWLLGFSGTAAAMWNAVILGVAVGLMALLHLRGGPMWEEWLNVLLGVWLILSPWLLGFSGLTNATWNAILVGILVGALALSVARERPKAT